MADSARGPYHHHARELGTDVLADVVRGTRAAVVVLDAAHRVVFGNGAACTLLGSTLTQLRGRDLLELIATDERAHLMRELEALPDGAPLTFTTLVNSEGAAREISGSVFTVNDCDRVLQVMTLWDESGRYSAAREGAALAATVSQLRDATGTPQLLHRITELAIEGTRATWCGMVVAGNDDRFGQASFGRHRRATAGPVTTTTAAVPVSASKWVEALTGGGIRLGGPPGKALILPDARSSWQRNPLTRQFAATLDDADWTGGVCVPLAWQGQVIGLCILTVPTGLTKLSENELAFVTALVQQATLAIMKDRLTAAAGDVAALAERGRLARDLHDSISQALFSITMHTRAANLAMNAADREPDLSLARSLAALSQLARDAMAEMRALIFDLRPDALSEDGLVTALRHQAAVLSARAGFIVSVNAPERRIALDDTIEEQLYRIGVEALTNVARHAQATDVVVDIEPDLDARTVRLVVTDDGIGFDPTNRPPGHFGRSIMAERARTIDARLSVISTPGHGATVTVVSPVYPRDPAPPS